jgi:type IV pilus assembly protein PilQ
MKTHLLLPLLLAAVPLLAQPAPGGAPAVAPAPSPATATASAPAATPAPAAPAADSTPAPAPKPDVVITPDGQPSAVLKDKDTVSFTFEDKDNRAIIQDVATIFDLNVVIDPTLTGKSTIKLHDVTWQQVFKSVLSPVNFTYVEDGNIIHIVNQDSLAQEPLVTDLILLSYAKADKDFVTSIAAVVGTDEKLTPDPRTNGLIITAHPSHLQRIHAIIEQLDRATDQVMIESKFIEVTDGDIRTLGVNWQSLSGVTLGAGNLGTTFSNSSGQATTNGNTVTNSTTLGSGNGSAFTVGPTNSNTITSTTSNTTADTLGQFLSLANTGATNRAATAVFTASQFNVILSALNTTNSVKVISNPTIVTLNNTEATINVGEEFPIPQFQFNPQTGSFEVNGFEYKAIGVILKVTPQVNARGIIRLTLAPEVSHTDGNTTFGGAAGASIPIIETQKTTTQVSLKDGSTLGIGGLITTQKTVGSTSVPVLGSIPLLGRLFRSDNSDLEKDNLMIFITAKTLSADGASVGQIFNSPDVRELHITPQDLPGYRDGGNPFDPPAPPEKNHQLPASPATAPAPSAFP